MMWKSLGEIFIIFFSCLWDFVRFVPNGARRYFLDRSQPPVLSRMVYHFVSSCTSPPVLPLSVPSALVCSTSNISSFLSFSLPLLKMEHDYWMEPTNNHIVNITTSTSSYYVLNRYLSNTSEPRPEEYGADLDTASSSSRPNSTIFREIRSGAETGWDFSSRWIFPNSSSSYPLSNISTSLTIPVELNCFLYDSEIIIANMEAYSGSFFLPPWGQLSQICDTTSTNDDNDDGGSGAMEYCKMASDRLEGMTELLFDDTSKQWRDLRLNSSTPFISSLPSSQTYPSHIQSISNYFPLSSLIYQSLSSSTMNDVVDSLSTSPLMEAPFGPSTTSLYSTQQWDKPNAWSPLISLIVQGLGNVNTDSSLQIRVNLLF